MAYEDDLLNAAQNRRRTGQSYFPAANIYRGINLNARPTANAINSTPQGQIIQRSGSGYAGYGIGNGALPPDQNPAYQAAISRPRLQRGDLTTIRTPSGGFVTVPSASAGAAAQAVPGSTVTQIGNQAPVDRAAAYAKGYGAPTPSVQNFAGGPALVQGGVANPVENLTPQQRVQYGQGGVLDYFRTNPALTAATNALGGFGQSVARFFGGGSSPSAPSTAAINPFGQAVQSGLNSVGGFIGGTSGTNQFEQPLPGRMMGGYQPRRYSDYGYY